MWGGARAVVDRALAISWLDVLILAGLAGLVFGLMGLAGQWVKPQQAAVEIDLSPWALPRYTFYSLSRGLLAYVISLTFTLAYGYWAAKDPLAQRVLIPVLDVLQSIPVLGFLPLVLLTLVNAFPRSNVGLELTSVIMIFTGQAWNMTFSFYSSVRSVPADQSEAATLFNFSAWERFKWLELPFSAIGLVWNSMMSMAGGWFFLAICEAFPLGDKEFRLPGLGAYMKVAVDAGRVDAMVWAVLAMVLMIVGLDQLLWRPVVVWAQKFRVEEGGAEPAMSSWFLDWLRRSKLLHLVQSLCRAVQPSRAPPTGLLRRDRGPRRGAKILSGLAFLLLVGGLIYGVVRLVLLLLGVPRGDWIWIWGAAGLTLARVLASTLIGTMWALPAGLAIGLSPNLSKVLQPVVQVVASFPAPMLFPMVIAVLFAAHVGLGIGSMLLMLLGTQWYILFNVIAGAMATPADLREMARSYRIVGWQRFRTLLFPAVFPYLVTGWITAAGGAWNASIVSEFVSYRGVSYETFGLGSLINKATANEQFALLAACVLVMALVVVSFNRGVWRRLYAIAEERYSLSK
jgi:NitT/TauT family transport system permease protein